MLAVSRGRLVALSTPFGKRGWYHDEWHGEGEWQRVKITAEQCSRIAPEFLAEERRAFGERWYRQESLCFPGDTDVITLDGVKPICEVRVGDYVLGHSNRYRKV